MRNFTIPEAADGLDRERVPNFAGRKRAAALGSINAFAAALLLAAAVLGLRPANAQVAPGFIPLQVTVDPGTASCEARLRQCFSCGPPPPGSDSQDSSEDGSAVACGNNSASSSLGDLLILEANGNTIGGPTFAAELGPSGAVTIIDFTGHGQAVGAFPFLSEATIRVLNRQITVSNPNSFPVGIVYSRKSWGEVFSVAPAFGLAWSASVLNSSPGTEDAGLSETLSTVSTPTSCEIVEAHNESMFQGTTTTPPLFLALVDDPRRSFNEVSTDTSPCAGLGLGVPANGSVTLDANGNSDAYVDLFQPTTSDVYAFFSELEVTTISLAASPPAPATIELVVTAHSPVDLLVTDPSGHRIGFDMTAGRFIDEIPGGQYSGHGSEPQTVVVPMPSVGTYSIQATGTDTGSYSIDVQSLGMQGNALGHASFADTASPGSASTVTTSLTASGSLGGADTTPPTTTAIPSPGPNANGWNNTNVTISLTAVDDAGGSGVKEIHFSQSGAQGAAGIVPGSSTSLTISTEGTTTLRFFAVDNAGNREAQQTVTARLDKTPPTLSCNVNPGQLWPPNHNLVPVTASVNEADALSGPGGFALVSISSNEDDAAADIQGFEIGAASLSGQLRAERSGNGGNRVYTLLYRGQDLAGNSATCSTAVLVPHDQR